MGRTTQGDFGVKPYYENDAVTLYHGDCLEIDAWLKADVLVTDPPYGIGWVQPSYAFNQGGHVYRTRKDDGILNDSDTVIRDTVLRDFWGSAPSIVFGSPLKPPPAGTKQVLIWKKPLNSGLFGTVANFRRDIEAIYLGGQWAKGSPDYSSVLATNGSVNQSGFTGHPHAKPVALLERLISVAPPGVIADPFAGSGSTLVAARNLGRRAIGVEIEERYCEIAARRLDHMCLDFEEPA
jgi:site-specific DNA-methyltransferase (adenine-specific)